MEEIVFLGAAGVLPFTPIVRVGSLLFVSGQASTDADGSIVPDSFEGEFHRSVDHLERLLQEAGSGLNHIVQVRAYVRDPANLPTYNRLYRERFGSPFPARTTLTGCLPETLHFEIECIATVKNAAS